MNLHPPSALGLQQPRTIHLKGLGGLSGGPGGGGAGGEAAE